MRAAPSRRLADDPLAGGYNRELDRPGGVAMAEPLYVVTGATGNVGSVVANALLDAKKPTSSRG